jgi:hypothetical protein
MSTYTVTETPSQLIIGGGNRIASIVNNGPSTIYLEDDTAVTVGNGMQLPPTGQMTWDAATPLFAMCAPGGTAVVVVNDAAGRVDASRASYYRQLAPSTIQANGPIIVETGFLNTLLMTFESAQDIGLSPGDVASALLEWMDGNQTVTYTETIYWNNMALASLTNVQVSVKGSYCRISVIPWNGLIKPYGFDRWTVYGTDRILPTRSWNSLVPARDGDGTAVYKLVDDALIATGVNSVATSGGIMLPSLGNHVYISFRSNAVTTAGQRIIIDTVTGAAFGDIQYSSGAVRGYTDFAVSPSCALQMVDSNNSPSFTNARLVFKFTN